MSKTNLILGKLLAWNKIFFSVKFDLEEVEFCRSSNFEVVKDVVGRHRLQQIGFNDEAAEAAKQEKRFQHFKSKVVD